MHPSMQERVAGLEAMRARTTLATDQMYALIGRPMPARPIRFQVISKGKAFHIVERLTGKTKGFCFTHRAAVNFAQALEAAADRKLVSRQ